MELDQLLRHYLDDADPATLTPDALAAAVDRLRIGFATERAPERRFALWTLLHAMDAAPPPADAFEKEPELRSAAERYLDAAFRIERYGDTDGA